ncbi:MAG: hypothetical protein Q8M11_21145 [Sulfuritalea sp.]|nr:hypothetical protein [Sulfuritalea sp.]MDP1982621.1 hypothetical protein [Sulfuritalea sp.]
MNPKVTQGICNKDEAAGPSLAPLIPRFSRIVIIQSLSAGESPTGRQLRDAIEPTAQFNHGISVEFVDTRTVNDFWAALEWVQETTEKTMDYPVLHLECHGLSDRSGLSLGDATPLPWAEVKTALVRLNQATQCNLFVSLAACHGAMLVETLDVNARAPCWGLMGPSGEVSPPDLVGSYSAFFLELLRSEDTVTALCALRDSPERRARYFLFTAEDMFRMVLQVYRVTCSTNTQMAERAERFAQTFRRHGMSGIEASSIGSHLYEAEHGDLERIFTRFFFVDHFQENKLRFTDAYSALAPDEFNSAVNKGATR